MSPVSFVAVYGHLELLRVGELGYLTLIGIEVFHISMEVEKKGREEGEGGEGGGGGGGGGGEEKEGGGGEEGDEG